MAHHPKRFESRDYIGRQSYFLTFACYERKPRLLDDTVARMLIEQLLRTAAAGLFAVTAYCVMTDHVHIVVTGRSDDCDLIKWINLFRQKTGYLYKQQTGEFLWQEGYWDRTLRSDESLIFAAAYTVANPVRAGLVRIASEYAYSGSESYSMKDLSEFVAEGDRWFSGG